MALTRVTPDVIHNVQSNITQVGTLGNLTVTNTIVGSVNGNANNASYLGGTPAASYALGSAVTTANTNMKGYVDGQISTTSSSVTTANTNMKGYVDAVTTAWTANAATQSGLIASKANSSDTLYIGTTSIALNRTSASQSLTGVNIDGSASYASSAGSASYASSAGSASTATDALSLGGTAAASYALTSTVIGAGQTWQNVSGSRSSGTTYTNSTGRPIFISIRWERDDGTLELTVDGLMIGRIGYTAGPVYYTLTAIVPAGSTYMATAIGSGGTLYWHELR
jgi:hypothetical protein